MQSVVGTARKSLDEALAAICDAHDQTLPAEYTVSLDQNNLTVTISEGDATSAQDAPPDAVAVPVPANGVDHASAPAAPSGGTP
jgi:hypothetical protein